MMSGLDHGNGNLDVGLSCQSDSLRHKGALVWPSSAQSVMLPSENRVVLRRPGGVELTGRSPWACRLHDPRIRDRMK